MARKFLVTLRGPDDARRVREAGVEVLAEYADAILVRTEDDTNAQLDGLEAAPLADPPVQTAGARYSMQDAIDVDASDPVVANPSRRSYYLVQFVGPAKEEWMDALTAAGARLHGSVAGYRVIVGLLGASLSAVEALPFVEAVAPYRPAMKVAPALRSSVPGRELDAASLTALDDVPVGVSQVEITVFEGESTEDVAARVREAGGTVLSTDSRTVVAQAPSEAITGVANEPGVEAILPFDFPQLTNDRARQILQVPPSADFGSFHLTGAGQIVGVADSGLDTGNAATVHPDLAGRVTVVSSPNQFPGQSTDAPPFDDGAVDEHAHGTHVAGSVAGNGAAATASGSAVIPRGIAPEAQLFFTAVGQRVNWNAGAFPPGQVPPAWGLFGIPNNLSNLFSPAYAAGARIHTNSWGNPLPANFGAYTAQARAVDEFMFGNRDMLVLFSAGNNGRDANGDVQIDGDSIGPPGTAKNCLTVGASENDRPSGSTPTPGFNTQWSAAFPPFSGFGPTGGHVSDNPNGMALFSSRGPCDDGRTKPDLVAPGTNVLSVRSTQFNATYVGRPAGSPPLWGEVLPNSDALAGDYCWSGGTSMSTPLVAGAAALVREHLVQQRGHVETGVKPSGALIKAFLVNGTVGMGAGQYAGEIPAVRPNNVVGFGRLDVMRVVAPEPLRSTQFSDEPALAVATGQMRTFAVQALDTGQPLRVTLCWTDAPSPAGVGGLQNQLYLQVAPPGGGAVIDGDTTAFPTATNNVQQIEIAAPVAGTYEIRVRGANVVTRSAGTGAPAGNVQDFALVVSNGMGLSVQPVTVAQAIDTTGSMAFFGYIDPAKERAAQLTDFLRFGDRLALVEFSERSSLPSARTPFPVRTLASFNPDWTDAHAAIGALVAEGLTPIGAGLQAAWGQLSGETAGRPRGIVLLSDGFNNRPPDPATVLPTIPNDVPIWAVALGPAALTPALQAIAASRPGGAYFSVASDEDVHRLHEIYAALQALSAGMALVGLSSAGPDTEAREIPMDIEAGLAEAVFTASWAGGEGRPEIKVIAPDGTERNAGTVATSVTEGAGHRIVRVGLPSPGSWRFVLARKPKDARITVSAAVPSLLRLTARVRPGRRREVLLAAMLADGTDRVDDARVVARLSVPTVTVPQVLKEHDDRLAQVKLDRSVDEKGLTKQQRRLLALAVFGREFAGQQGGLLARVVVEIELEAHGNGWYGAAVDFPADGTAHVNVSAEGKRDRFRWQRHSQFSADIQRRKVPPY